MMGRLATTGYLNVKALTNQLFPWGIGPGCNLWANNHKHIGCLYTAVPREIISRYIAKILLYIFDIDALAVTTLTNIMTAFATVNTAYYTYIRSLGPSINTSSFRFRTFWVYWGLQAWNCPRNFGIPDGEKNCTTSIGTVFVVFGHNVSVSITNSGLFLRSATSLRCWPSGSA
ncbi:hypothetical protein RSOLAG1IB_01703 [Rhizoctonia solani AG-1 IB]|uniref:Uncharacterized protein n=1 Tax=Thanatephorus cucumeris (strain AG1-IB / isolate 7/3/14) TaxID=1108050 RepID=A0A0B7FCE5_THACB|nr:hypothetical protein RSOLAG1IB_01703 [Rhizoctonia solani AG-1 IB]